MPIIWVHSAVVPQISYMMNDDDGTLRYNCMAVPQITKITRSLKHHFETCIKLLEEQQIPN